MTATRKLGLSVAGLTAKIDPPSGIEISYTPPPSPSPSPFPLLAATHADVDGFQTRRSTGSVK